MGFQNILNKDIDKKCRGVKLGFYLEEWVLDRPGKFKILDYIPTFSSLKVILKRRPRNFQFLTTSITIVTGFVGFLLHKTLHCHRICRVSLTLSQNPLYLHSSAYFLDFNQSKTAKFLKIWVTNQCVQIAFSTPHKNPEHSEENSIYKWRCIALTAKLIFFRLSHKKAIRYWQNKLQKIYKIIKMHLVGIYLCAYWWCHFESEVTYYYSHV